MYRNKKQNTNIKNTKKMTKKAMIIKLVNDQAKRGIIKTSNRAKMFQYYYKTMSFAKVEEWYEEVFGE